MMFQKSALLLALTSAAAFHQAKAVTDEEAFDAFARALEGEEKPKISKMKPVGEGTPKLVNGEPAEVGEYPYYTHMKIETAAGPTYSCGGSLIAPRVILSAAHCNDPYEESTDESGYVGATEFWSTNAGAVLGECSEWKNHPDFIPGEFTEDGLIVDGTTVLGGNDFALCLLPEDIDIDQSQVFLELNDDSSVPRSNDVTESPGMGTIDPGRTELTDVLLRADLPVYSTFFCNLLFFGDIDSTMLCTYDSNPNRSGTCSGDSGGPIVLSSTEPDGRTKHTQIGVVSWGAGLCGTFPDVHARVSAGYGWIKSTVCDEWGVEASFCDDTVGCFDTTESFTVVAPGGDEYDDVTCDAIAGFLASRSNSFKERVCGSSTTDGNTVGEACEATCGCS